MSPRFACVTSGILELLLSLFVSEAAYLVSMECLSMIKPMGLNFCAIGG